MRSALAGLLLFACACATPVHQAADPGPSKDFSRFGEPEIKRLRIARPTHILFVGNSYLYYGDSVHNHVSRMVLAAGLLDEAELAFKSSTIGGAALSDHNIDHLIAPENLRVDRPFQIVVLQGGSAAPLSQEQRRRFAETAAEFSGKISRKGGETVLYMTHAFVEPHPRHRPNMIDDISSLYIETGNKIGALVVPVGLAFEEAYRRRPGLQLHKSFDGSHPDLPGTYLAAATVFASLYGVSPVGSSYDYFGAINAETALFLQTVARDTVEAFFGHELAEAPN